MVSAVIPRGQVELDFLLTRERYSVLHTWQHVLESDRFNPSPLGTYNVILIQILAQDFGNPGSSSFGVKSTFFP